MHRGVDISSIQDARGAINWGALYQALKTLGGGDEPFVVIKATEGTTYTNPSFVSDVAKAKAAGFKAIAGYLFDHGTDSVTAEQAHYRAVAGLTPEIFDDETADGMSAAAYAQHCANLAAQNPAAEDYLNQSETSGGFPRGGGLYLADYNGRPCSTPWQTMIHQYTDAMVVAGIVGAVDGDAWCGTEAEFENMFGIIPAVIPTPLPPFNVKDDQMPQTLAPGADTSLPAQVGNYTAMLSYDPAGKPNTPGAGITVRVAIGNSVQGWKAIIPGAEGVPGDPFAFFVPAGATISFPVVGGALVSIWNMDANGTLGIDRFLG